MAPKRTLRLDDPPPASLSEEEEGSDSIDNKEDGDEDQEQENNHQEAASEEEEEESDEEEEEDDEETPPIPPTVDKKPSVQKPATTTTTTTTPKPQSSSESEGDEGSDSESDSDNTLNSPTASDFTVKPIVSKPMDDPSKPKKRSSKPAAAAPVSATHAKAAAKRPADSEQNGKRKKKSKVSNVDEEDGAVEEKKSAISRLWSDEDAIAILKGMIDYQSKKGTDPYTDMVAFHEFIKESLHVNVSKGQLTDKIRRLKKKYQNNAGKGENGEDPVFSRPFEHKSFELSKKIWGGGTSNGVDDKSNISKSRKSGRGNNFVTSPKKDAQELALPEVLKGEVKADQEREVKADQEDFWSMYPRLNESLQLKNSSYLSLSEPERIFVKENMSLIGSTKAKELEKKWKNLHVEEIELYLKRINLIQEQTELALDAMKSSES